ncbi:MAG: 3-hydroxyacyl-CoA dehydrogenase/enoyl-CoA hydratase family protein [Elusimicrobia bacterium]|nr:3-hydroxyacyl-CoA dehydrogenase/enoyl-CoA hydratase family protein [Elusimicrobiota bacterium]
MANALFHVGVVGAGTMGGGIAQKSALEGARVTLVDQDRAYLDKALLRMKEMFREGVERKVLKPGQTEAALARIHTTLNVEDLRDCDLVIEAVYEDEKAKREVFRRLDEACGEKTIFATNTSSLSVAELAGSTDRADRFVGMHFFYHPVKNRLVEVIACPRTSPESLRVALLYSKAMGKVAIRVQDRPGFAVNRFFVPWLNEAARILEEGAANVASIEETARKSFGIGMGPFELMNATGIPIAFHAASTLSRTLGPFYAPSAALRRQSESGEKWRLETVPTSSQSLGRDPIGKVSERLWGVVFWVASCLEEEGTASREDIDRGAKIGLRWSQGPFETMNALGTAKALEWVEKLCALHSLPIPGSFRERSRRNQKWPLKGVDAEQSGGIARIVINRPEAMNALTPELLRDLDQALEETERKSSLRGVVLEGAGKAFAAGADVKFFVQAMERKDYGSIESFTRLGHQVLARIAEFPIPIVAKLEGPALGGGAELALACRFRAATERAVLAFPETGIGIYPGLGGTQRLSRLVGKELAKYFILTGSPIPASLALELGIVDLLAPPEGLEQAVEKLLERAGRAVSPAAERRPLPEHIASCGSGFCVCLAKKHFSDSGIRNLLAGDFSGVEGTSIEKPVKSLSRKAPLALKLAERIVEEGSRMDLQGGLALELSHLLEIFQTRDAYEGLSCLGRRFPVFTGT